MRAVFTCLALLAPGLAKELTIDVLKDSLVKQREAFVEVELKAGGATVLSIELGDKPGEVRGEVFDGFRFRCPELPEEADFVWYFNTPEHWGNWYILPVEGKPGEAFTGWLEGDKVYQELDKGGEKGRLRVLQSLDGDYFEAGAEYLMWFRRTGEGKAADLRGRMAFAKGDSSWDHDEIEEALGLKPASPEDQVAALSSRGGMILLDDAFFQRRDAIGRIDSAFHSIRSTKRMSGGFFITTQIAVPPCATSPSFKAIVAKHGPPDFSRAGSEVARVREHAKGSPPDEEEKGITRHYYDYFAFEVETDAGEPEVLRVVTHGSDFSALRPPAEGAAFAGIDIENLTVFHKNGEEVGRAYYFREGGKKPLFVAEPPAGEYRSGNERLVYSGEGEWRWESRFDDGTPATIQPMKGHRREGTAKGFHRNGKPRFTAEYREGVLDGEVVQFDEDGGEISRQVFKNGEPVKE